MCIGEYLSSEDALVGIGSTFAGFMLIPLDFNECYEYTARWAPHH